MSISVTAVRTRSDQRDFIALPARLHARDAGWVAPPASSVRHAMSARANPFQREALIEHFVARDGQGTCVGRVAAVVHPEHIRRHGAQAFFGCFECIDAEDVARSLLERVEAWADERGIRVVQGPCTYAMTQEAGLLIEGFDAPPVLLQAHNPRYYTRLLRAAGYDLTSEMSTFTISRAEQSEAVRAAMLRGDAAARELGLSARSIEMARFGDELEGIRVCYNAAFAAHPETVAISRDTFADQAAEMKPIVDPSLVRIVEKDGVPRAFSVAVPNVHELLAPSQGRLTLSLVLRWRQLLRRVRSMVVIMIGADPALEEHGARGAAAHGVGSCLAAQLAHALSDAQYETVHTTWIHERNWRALSLMRAIGAKPSKRYGIFRRAIV